MQELSIDWCPINSIGVLQEFIKTYWRPDHIFAHDRDFLLWQYPLRDDAQKISVLVAGQESSLQGMLGVIPFNFCARGQLFSGAWLSMWMVPPEQRNVGLGLQLLRRVLAEGYDVIGTLGGRDVPLRIFGALHFDVRKSIPRWVCVISPATLKDFLSHQKASYPLSSLPVYTKASSPRFSLPDKSGIRLINWDDKVIQRWNTAWLERFARRLVGTWRDAEYLRWRYVDHPLFHYVLHFAEDTTTGQLVGLLVYRIETVQVHSDKVLRVVEFLCEKAAEATLAQKIVEAGEVNRVAYADFYCTSERFGAPLKSVGFELDDNLIVHLPNRFQLINPYYKPVPAAFRVEPRIAGDSFTFFNTPDLYFTRSDCDQDRPS